MARQRRLGPLPAVRGVVRSMVRGGESRRRILNEVRTLFPSVAPQQTGRIISEETRRQSDVDRMFEGDKRRSFDAGRDLGCSGPSGRLRMSITVTFRDPQTGIDRVFTHTAETAGVGRLADILNDAIGQVATAARDRGSPIPHLTSANTSGGTRYRINYVDCL